VFIVVLASFPLALMVGFFFLKAVVALVRRQPYRFSFLDGGLLLSGLEVPASAMTLGSGVLGGLLAATLLSVALAVGYPWWATSCDLATADGVGQMVAGTWSANGRLAFPGSCTQSFVSASGTHLGFSLDGNEDIQRPAPDVLVVEGVELQRRSFGDQHTLRLVGEGRQGWVDVSVYGQATEEELQALGAHLVGLAPQIPGAVAVQQGARLDLVVVSWLPFLLFGTVPLLLVVAIVLLGVLSLIRRAATRAEHEELLASA